MAQSLAGEVALVTGATSDIGASVARLFSSEGAAVIIHGRNRRAAEAIAGEINGSGGRAAVCIGDLNNPSEVSQIVADAEAALGPLTVLVANAGGNLVPPGPIEAITLEQWRATVDGNLTLTFLTIAAVLPGMRARGKGSIVTISSAAARRPTAQSPTPYAAAKAGIETLTQMVALQAGPDGVRANCVAPETILTGANSRRIPADVQEQLIQAHPLRRLGTPEDVAHAALYLASDSAGWVSGVTIDIAGGSVIS